ncbi:MAG: exodeoxyribonuclease VII large subunit [Bacilli bacterium]|nr:exodeoxyribonuclease VII large subunit [Bacilli bacterium]
MKDKYITVIQLSKYLKYKFDNDVNLDTVYLKGEISNFKAHSRGHFYFTLKDEESRINAVMFSSSASKIKFTPQDGMKVLVTGKVTVYPQNGGYQIYVNEMLEDGVGNLYIAYEQLKKKLEDEGLFDKSHKKKIPYIPNRIGVVTAPTGAAIRDIISTIKRRWPLAEVILFPSLVQGEFAKEDIVKQIKRAEDYNLDTLIVGRGGGSIEDLWAFNEEIVARAIYECSIPVISAVGHEIDFTIADFVADMRAPTPTGAAEISVPNLSDVSNLISQINIRLNKAISNKIEFSRRRLLDVKSRHIFKEPIKIYEAKEQKFDFLMEKLKFNILNIYTNRSNSYLKIKENIIFKNPNVLFEKKQNDYLRLISKLETLSPLLTIKRGYSISRVNNKVINSVKDVKKKDLVEIELSDGKINAEVV